MYSVKEEFYTKEVNNLLHEEDKRGLKKLYFLSTLMLTGVGYSFTTMEPLISEGDIFERIDDPIAKTTIKTDEPKKPEQKKPEPKKVTKVTKRHTLKDVNRQQSQARSTAGGGDPSARVTSKGVLGIISSTIKGASAANADPFGKGGFSTDLDALLAGSGGLKRGGGDAIGRKGASGIGFGSGFGSGFGGGNGVSWLVSSVGGAESVQLQKRAKIRVPEPSSITGTSQGGGRSKEAIRKVVMKKIGGLKYLYSKYLKMHPELEGKITVKMVIAPSGKVIRATVLESSLQQDELEREIVKKIKRWSFDRVPKGTATVIYPFNFSS